MSRVVGYGLQPTSYERQFVDDAIALVSRYFVHYSVFRPGFVMDILKLET
ncbi:MAG TPA: hypothetical protein VJ440_03250 [Candidatus Brocadiaceae bacterium]|nr:hypothetical protein [Candidatus Brocadiaceae bacterium]